MARKSYNYYGNNTTQRKTSSFKRKKSKYSSTEKFAYQLGLVKRGLKNPDSLISESYDNGLNSKKEPKEKKTLFGD